MEFRNSKSNYAIELLSHSYHTLALSKEVYNFVFSKVLKSYGFFKEINHTALFRLKTALSTASPCCYLALCACLSGLYCLHRTELSAPTMNMR